MSFVIWPSIKNVNNYLTDLLINLVQTLTSPVGMNCNKLGSCLDILSRSLPSSGQSAFSEHSHQPQLD